MNTMKRTAFAGALLGLFFAFSASATTIVFDLDPHEGSFGFDVRVTVDDASNPAGVLVTVDLVQGTQTGDITQVLFDLANPIPGLTSGSITSLNTPFSVASNQPLPPLGSFDWRVTIGTSPGIPNGDDFQSATLLISNSALTANDFASFAVRVQSVGAHDGKRNDSAKFFGDDPFTPPESVPEPSTWALMAGGIGLVALGRWRRRKA